MSDRWIFSFRRVDQRELSDEDRNKLQDLSKGLRWLRIAWGIGAVLCVAAAILGIAAAAGGSGWWWIVVIALVISFFWALSFASQAERKILLYRRALRKGVVDGYARSERSAEVLAAYSRDLSDDEHTQPSIYWEADERFEKKIANEAGHQPNRIETPAGDDVLITVEGKIVVEIIDVPVLDVRIPKPSSDV
jgi:hypothetical protein